MLIGPAATKHTLEDYSARIRNNHQISLLSQLCVINFSTLCDDSISRRHVTSVLCLIGKEERLVAGGLTRVALGGGHW